MNISHNDQRVFRTNLFPLKVDLSGIPTSVLKTYITERGNERKILNKLRFRLAKELQKPVYYYLNPNGEAFFVVLGEVKEKIEITLDEVLYEFEPVEGLKEIPQPSAQDVEYIVKDLLRFENIDNKLSKSFNNVISDPRLEKIVVFPQVELQVWNHFGDYLLQLDIHYRIVPFKNLQQLLEEGTISVEDILQNREFRVKPSGVNRTFRILELKRASEYPEDFLKTTARRATQEYTKRLWEKVLGSDLDKIYIATLEGGYVYPAQILRPVLDFNTIENTQEVSKLVKLPPQKRFSLILQLLGVVRRITSPYGIEISPKPVELDEKDKVEYLNEVVDAKGEKRPVKGLSLKPFLERCQPFIRKETLKVQILVVENKEGNLNEERKLLLKEVFKLLASKGIGVKLLQPIGLRAKKTRNDTRIALAPILAEIKERTPDLVIAFIPSFGGFDIVKELSLYDYIKQTLLGANIPSQIVLNKTLLKRDSFPFVALNLVEQILGKTGNIPYKLARPLEGSSAFIGIDISRAPNRGKSVNAGAFTKIFFADGTFLKYSIQNNPATGEELTEKAIDSLFLRLLEHRIQGRITVHRDGPFRGKEIELFLSKAKDFGYELELIEVIKSKNPRFFGYSPNIKGLYYQFDENTAVVATYNNSNYWVHRPIRVRKVHGQLPLKLHVSNILSLTLLNYASFKTIRLPATTHYSDKIAALLLRGITPAKQEGEEMFWL